VAVAALLLAPAAPPTRASFPGTNGRIFYSRFVTQDQPSTLEIFSIRPDGTGFRRLTNNDEGDRNPSVSADGRWLVFQRTIGGNEEILKMRTDGSRRRRLTNNSTDDFDPSWSPNGNQIVFAGSIEAPNAIHKMKANGDDVEAITAPTPGLFDSAPAWSPDGDQILFQRFFNGANVTRIFVIAPNGADLDPVSDGTVVDPAARPSWAPNSRKFVFEGELVGSDESDIFAMKPDGSNLVPLTYGVAAEGFDPAYSPNGAKIVFRRGGLPRRIFTLDKDGFGIERLTPAAHDVIMPDWGRKPG
jgi:Tol biopolymer transport system component